MNKLNMLIAATIVSSSAALVPVGSALADTVRVEVHTSGYSDVYRRGRLSVRPSVADVDTRLTLSARGLRPLSRLVLVAGRSPSRLQTIRSVRTDANGRLFVRMSVPAWAQPGRNLFFALQTSGGRIVAQAQPIQIVDDEEDEEDNSITVTGELLDPSATCPRLAGDDGRIYALAGSLRQFETGDRVQVTGEPTEVSICQQRRTITVERIRDAQ